MTSRRVNATLGIAGGTLLVLFFLGMISPEGTNSVVGKHGLLSWGAVLIAAIALPGIAAIRGSKWWFVLVALGVITSVGTLALALK
jgi:hypothetical protein